MSKQKIKEFTKYVETKDKNDNLHIVLVYGELMLTKDSLAPNQVKLLNFGYAICSPEDKNNFDVNVGKRIAKKRFYRYPLITVNHNFLNDDMVEAIIQNEVDYICKNLEKYINRKAK